MEIKENKDGIFINGVKQEGVEDVQVIKNPHRKVEVQVTYLADDFLKEDFNAGSNTKSVPAATTNSNKHTSLNDLTLDFHVKNIDDLLDLIRLAENQATDLKGTLKKIDSFKIQVAS